MQKMQKVDWFKLLKVLSLKHPEYLPLIFTNEKVDGEYAEIERAFLELFAEWYNERIIPCATICALIRATVCHPELYDYLIWVKSVPFVDGGHKGDDFETIIAKLVGYVLAYPTEAILEEMAMFENAPSPIYSAFLVYAYRTSSWYEQTLGYYLNLTT